MEPGGSGWRRIAPYQGDSGFSGFIPDSSDMVTGKRKMIFAKPHEKGGSGNSASPWIV
jgi:hypothetical protein